MTQAYVAPWVSYIADGIGANFPYPFRIGVSTDLLVAENDVVVTAYTVTGVGAPNGGNVVFTVPPASGHRIFLVRRTPFTQLVDYIHNDAFGADTHEAALDKLTREVQDLTEPLSRVPQLAPTAPNSLRNLIFPAPGAGELIGWNVSGTSLTTYPRLVPPAPGSGAGFGVALTDFGAVGDGVTDDSEALQNACNYAVAAKVPLRIPAAAVGYRINTTINLTDLDAPLLMVGDGAIAPAFGAVLVPPTHGSIILGNTGVGNPVFECLGSNNILLRDVTISALGQSTPSTMGIVFGTSTTSPALQAPGGTNCSLENVAIWLPFTGSSIPLYFVSGAGLSHYINLWTIGDFGIVMTANDDFAYSSQYATVGTPIGVDGMHFMGCNILTYGSGAALYIEESHNMQFDQLYVATIFGGAAYAGTPYAINLKNTTDIKIKIELDYYPAVLFTEGIIINVHLEGTTFPNQTPIPVDVPIIAYFSNGAVRHSTFRIEPVMAPKTNYHYTTNGTTANMLGFNSCEFYFSRVVSDNVAFFNTVATLTKPFFNLRFDGSFDAGVYSFLINGVPAGAGTMRYWENGVLVGSG